MYTRTVLYLYKMKNMKLIPKFQIRITILWNKLSEALPEIRYAIFLCRLLEFANKNLKNISKNIKYAAHMF